MNVKSGVIAGMVLIGRMCAYVCEREGKREKAREREIRFVYLYVYVCLLYLCAEAHSSKYDPPPTSCLPLPPHLFILPQPPLLPPPFCMYRGGAEQRLRGWCVQRQHVQYNV